MLHKLNGDDNPESRLIKFDDGLPRIPERLLLSQAKGQVLFLTGAGISRARPSGLPDFRSLVIDIYEKLDAQVYSALLQIPRNACNNFFLDYVGFNPEQSAEIKRFIQGDYDVVLGMLERRLQGAQDIQSEVRLAVINRLSGKALKSNILHKSLVKLSNRGNATSILTTNFDRLLQKSIRPNLKEFSLGAIPRPTHHHSFNGVMHLHGLIPGGKDDLCEMVLTDLDFGEHYLRRRTIPDFIYDAARLYNIVLVGYSANDPPMRYLMNALSADQITFPDIKERFTFIPLEDHDEVSLADWKARGITPIHYEAPDGVHLALERAIEIWSQLSPFEDPEKYLKKFIQEILNNSVVYWQRNGPDKIELIKHFVRRSNTVELEIMIDLIGKSSAAIEWLDVVNTVIDETAYRGAFYD